MSNHYRRVQVKKLQLRQCRSQELQTMKHSRTRLASWELWTIPTSSSYSRRGKLTESASWLLSFARVANSSTILPKRSTWRRHKLRASWSNRFTPCATCTRTEFAIETSSQRTSCCTKRMTILTLSWSTLVSPKEWSPTKSWINLMEHHITLHLRC